MTLIYRAVWQDADHVPPAVLEDEFRGWCESKGVNALDFPYRGTVAVGGQTVDVRRGDSESGRVYRGRLEEIGEDGRHWITTATAILVGQFRGYWVDLEIETRVGDGRIVMAAPRLVRRILAEDGSPARGPVAVSATHEVVRTGQPVEDVRDLLYHEERDIPLIVFSADEHAPVQVNDDRARLAAQTLAGVAHVSLLWPAAVDQFNAGLPEGMRVYGGAVRVYLPRLEEGTDSARHRYWAVHQFRSHPRRAGQLVARWIASAGRWPQPPRAWEQVRHLVARPTDEEFEARRATIVSEMSVRADERDGLRKENHELLQLLVSAERERDAALRDGQAEIVRLSLENEVLQNEVLDDVTGMEALALENRGLRQTVRSLAVGAGTASVPDGDRIDPEFVELPTAPSAAIELARQHLDLVVIPDEALREVDRLDGSLKDRVWAEHTWQGLCAFQRYAEEVRAGVDTGGFFVWCQRTGAWSTTKLAMVESDSVTNNDDLAKHRLLPVSTDVDDNGAILMQAHLKIQPGGGMNIPRLYFHDDTRGGTGRIHVGFYGPHDLMPNTKSK